MTVNHIKPVDCDVADCSGKSTKPGWKRFVLLGLLMLAAWSPAYITASMMSRYSVNIPVWDDMERAELLARYEQGTLDWHFLASAHIEHRILLTRLIILANARFGGGDLRHEVAVNYLAMLISALGLAWLVRKTRPGRPSNWLLIFLINLCVFSLLQYENLCWAVQTAFFMPLTFMALALVVLRSSLKLPVQFILALLCALGGTASFAHGLVIWPLVAVYFSLKGNDWPLKKRVLVVGAWGLIAAFVWFLYFNGITSTSHPSHSYLQRPGAYPPGFSDVVGGELSVLRVLHSFILALGSHYCRVVLVDPKIIAPWIGSILLFTFAVLAALAVVRSIRSRCADDWNNLLPWLAVGGYAAGAAFLVSMGRSNFGVFRALSPRYLTISLYLSVALIMLFVLVIPSLVKSRENRLRVWSAGCFLAGLFFLLQSWNWLYGYRGLQLWSAARWQSLAEHVFRGFSPSEHPARLDFDSDFAREQIDRLEAMGYLHLPAPVSTADFDRFIVSPHEIPADRGGVIRVAAVDAPAEGWRIDGFSNIRTQIGRVPDAVIFTAGNADNRRIIGFAEPVHTEYSHFIALDFEFEDIRVPNQEDQNRWSGCLQVRSIISSPETPVEVTIWAVDFKNNTVFKHQDPVFLHPDDRVRSNAERPWKRSPAGMDYEKI